MADGGEEKATYEWSAFYDDDGKLYYFNSVTEESAWDPPADGKFNPAPPREEGEDSIKEGEKAKTGKGDEPEWEAYKDEEGQEYFYNNVTGETSWEKPDNYVEPPAADEQEKSTEKDSSEKKQEEAASPPAADEQEKSTEKDSSEKKQEEAAASGQNQDDEPANSEPAAKDSVATEEPKKVEPEWVAYKDDEGQEYYCNSATGETSWEKPDNYVEPSKEEEDSKATENGASKRNEGKPSAPSKPVAKDGAAAKVEKKDGDPEWVAYKDDEGQEYYYNSATGETSWEKPDNYVEPAKEEEEPKASRNENSKQNDGESAQPVEPVAKDSSAAEETEKGGPEWVIHKDDEGQDYYYNTASGETQWEKPDNYVEPAKEKEVIAAENEDSKEKEGDKAGSSEPAMETAAKSDEPSAEQNKSSESGASAEPAASSEAESAAWVIYKDDEGRDYFYNTVSGETQWDKPDNYVEPEEKDTAGEAEREAKEPESDGADEEPTSSGPGEWVAYKDDEGREYYYNATTGETQWDKPDSYVEAPPEDAEETESKSVDGPMPDAGDEAKDDEMEVEAEEPEPEPEEEIDPAVKRVQDAEAALNKTDSILEPSCLNNVSEVVTSEGGNPQKAITALIENYRGQTAVCGLLGRWLADLRSPSSDGPSQASTDQVREETQDVINRLVKERFSKETGDRILNLSKAEAAFLEDMMDSPRWRKLLIDLSASHKDSAVLVYCLRAISKRGHHREIAKRVNQSDHFAVFNAMLQSELSIIGNIAVSSGSDAASAAGLDELVNDLRRACSSTSYTYLYSLEALRLLEAKAKKLVEDSNSDHFRRAIRKWQALVQNLESAMIDPATASSVAGSSPLFRKRRLDVALTVSELHQRQRRRIKPLDSNGIEAGGNDEAKKKLETALLNFLRRHSVGMQVDDAAVDALLPSGLDLNTSDEAGKLLIEHPLAVKALLGHLFKPGTTRVSSPVLRNKCARLVAFAVLAAEKSARAEGGARGLSTTESSDEVGLTRMIVEASQLCEQLESMVSFSVTDKPRTSTSPGEKLCSMALKYAAVAQGVIMWAYEFTHGPEFASSPAFPTLSVSALSLVRIISLQHPFTRRKATEVGLAFLRHSNADISYQKVNSIKEQSLRLLLFLLLKGELQVLKRIAQRLEQSGTTEMDASLVRYFVEGILTCIRPPVSLEFVVSFGKLLQAPKCIDAVRSNYFKEVPRQRLVKLLQSFAEVKRPDGSKIEGNEASLVKSLHSLYQVDSN